MGPDRAQMDRLMAAMEAKGRRPRPLRRTVLAVAALCAALVLTVAAAYVLDAFDFLKGRDEYAMLGQTEVYEQYAQPVGTTAAAENGDVLTVDWVAMDGKFCTIFYSIRFHDPVAGPEKLAEMRTEDYSDLWAGRWEPEFTLYAGGEEVSEHAYNNSFEPQHYLADANTLYGAWRFLLKRPVAQGETVELGAVAYEERQSYDVPPRLKWDLSVSFTARPIQGEHFAPGASFPVMLQGQTVQVEVAAVDRSPLGTLLTLYREKVKGNDAFGPEFALRDADTGAWIPCAEVVTSHYGEPEGYTYDTYELFGDVTGLKTLELVPVWRIGSVSPQHTVALADLPATDSGNPAGGFTPASYRVGDGKLIVEMKPVGATTWGYAWLGNGVYFLDAEGNGLFEDVKVEKYKDRSDGTITVVCTPSRESFQADVDKVAQIWHFVQRYDLLEGQAVSIPLE